MVVDRMEGPDTPMAEVDLLGGSYGTWRGALKVGGQFGAINAIGDLSRFQTDGYREHSAATRNHFNGKLKYGNLTVVANSLRQPDTQDPLGLTRAQLEQDPRQATPQAIQFNTKKTLSQDQLAGTNKQRLGEGRAAATFCPGQGTGQQFLAIPINPTQNKPTHSGG